MSMILTGKKLLVTSRLNWTISTDSTELSRYNLARYEIII